jgi:hypothetical protein
MMSMTGALASEAWMSVPAKGPLGPGACTSTLCGEADGVATAMAAAAASVDSRSI